MAGETPESDTRCENYKLKNDEDMQMGLFGYRVYCSGIVALRLVIVATGFDNSIIIVKLSRVSSLKRA